MNSHPDIEEAKARVRRRICEARKGVEDRRLAAFLRALEKRVFDEDFKVSGLKRKRESLRTIEKLFKAHFRATPKVFVNDLKMVEAKKLLELTDLKIWEVARFAGHSPSHFTRAFTNREGKSPENWRKAKGLSPRSWARKTTADHGLSVRVKSVDPEIDRRAAEVAWKTLVKLSPQKQRKMLEGGLLCCHTRSFLNLLGEMYLEEGRLVGRERGIEIAELGVLSLESYAGALGDEIYDLKALAWSRVGNARRLAFDMEGAEEAFTKAEELWGTPRDLKDRAIRAELLGHKAQLRATQRRFEEALELLSEMIAESHLGDAPRHRARALIQRSAIIDYSGCIEEETICDLEEALEILERDVADARLIVGVNLNLAFAYIQSGEYLQAEAKLEEARGLGEGLLEDPLLLPQSEWLRGLIALSRMDLEGAQSALSRAQEEYGRLGENERMAVVSLDLARVRIEEGLGSEAIRLGSEVLPFLENLKADPEILRTVRVFRDALDRGELSRGLLEQARSPLVRAVQETPGIGERTRP